LLQLAVPLVDLFFHLRWELHLFRERRRRRQEEGMAEQEDG
jgi:hypothetical protein